MDLSQNDELASLAVLVCVGAVLILVMFLALMMCYMLKRRAVCVHCVDGLGYRRFGTDPVPAEEA